MATTQTTNGATPPQSSVEPDTRPLILALHGGGSTSTVFKIQCRRLIWALSSQFRFIFAQAPFEGPPGHGMLPTFATLAPFHRWVTRKWTLGSGAIETTPASEIEAVEHVLDDCVERETGTDRDANGGRGGWGNVVGCIGFSQGARLVPGLLLRQKMAERENKEKQQCSSKWDFKFGVVVGGPYPPICLQEEGEVEVSAYELLKEVPTVHAWGREDHVKSGCVEMRDMCESDVCFQMDFEGGHHMPLKDGEARDLCDLIMAAWYAGGGTYEVGKGEKY